MKPWMTPIALAILVLTGCATAPEQEQPTRDANAQARAPLPEAPKAPPAALEPDPGRPPQQEEDFLQRLLKQHEDQIKIGQDQSKRDAETHYKMAESYFVAGDYPKAELEAQEALKLDKDHADAKNLLQISLAVQGKAKIDPQAANIRDMIDAARARGEQVRIEVQDAYTKGIRDFQAARYDEAERQFMRVLDIIRVLPPNINMDHERKMTEEYLEKTREARRLRLIEEEEIRQKMIHEEARLKGLTQRLAEFRKLEILFGQALLEFERENYRECANICKKILDVDPTLKAVKDMQALSHKLMIKKEHRDNLLVYREQWKRSFEFLDKRAMAQRVLLEFPERELWEQIARRSPKSLHPESEIIPKEDQEIAEKLKSIRMTMKIENTPLPAFIDNLRERLKPMNFHIIAQGADAVMVNVDLKNIPLENLLNLVLGNDLGYYVKDGIVYIAQKDQIQKQLIMDIYDVMDLTFVINDFPGLDLTLTPEAAGLAAPPNPPGTRFDIQSLVDLIKKSMPDLADGNPNGATIEPHPAGGVLIVRAPRETHKKLMKLLTDLRRMATVLVNVQIRFLVVQEHFLENIGIEYRDLAAGVGERTATGLLAPYDIIVPFNVPPFFMLPYTVLPTGNTGTFVPTHLDPRSSGITGVFGGAIQKNVGVRIQNILWNDNNVQRFYQSVISNAGGLSAQFGLLDDVSLQAILRAVRKYERSHAVLAGNLTMFNAQRANMAIINQQSYVSDIDVQVIGNVVVAQPVVSQLTDGVSLDFRPFVSSDRKYITLDIRPTVAVAPTMRTVGTGVGQIEAPQLSIQRIRTTVTLPDQGTILLGGMGYIWEEDAETGIPFFRDLPIINSLAKEKMKGTVKRQHITLLRCKILIPEDEEKKWFW